MTETIRLLAIVCSPRDLHFWGDHLAIHCRTRALPPGDTTMASVTDVTDPYSCQILENVHLVNATAKHSSPAGPPMLSETVVLELTLTTPQPVRYRTLPWLEQAVRSYVEGPGLRPTAVTAVYLICDEAGTIQVRRISGGATDEVPTADVNWSYIDRRADFLDDIYYHGGPSAVFAPQAATLTLQFGQNRGGVQ